MKRRNGFFIFATLAIILSGSLANAADKNSQFGVAWGLSVPDADNTNPFHLFGVKGEAFLIPQFSAGGYFFNSDHSGELSSAQKFRYSMTGVQAAYHVPQANGDTFFALRVGMTKLQKNVTTTQDATFSPYHYGITAGYDYYVFETVSVGFEGSYLHVLPGRTTAGGVEYNQDSFNIINFLVTLQLRL